MYKDSCCLTRLYEQDIHKPYLLTSQALLSPAQNIAQTHDAGDADASNTETEEQNRTTFPGNYVQMKAIFESRFKVGYICIFNLVA